MRTRSLLLCAALLAASGCQGDDGGDDEPPCLAAITLTPAPTQGQPYQVRVGDAVALELAQVEFMCSPVSIGSVRWESTDPAVAGIVDPVGPSMPGGAFRARLVALSPGRTTVRAFYTSGGRESEATGSQQVFVVP